MTLPDAYIVSPPLVTSLTKKQHTTKQKIFLAASFETFTRSVEHTGPEKFLRKATCIQVFFFPKIPKTSRTPELSYF